MTITLNRDPNGKDRLLEIGGGSNPIVKPECQGGRDVCIDGRSCNDVNGKQVTDIVWDLEKFPWPIADNDFDGVVSVFFLEHLPYTKTKLAILEMLRVSKPGSKTLCVVPNTENQIKWIMDHSDGWDGKPLFEAASEKLFGSQNDEDPNQQVMKGRTHAAYFNPMLAISLFKGAGYQNVTCRAYGERETDLAVEATKPIAAVAQTPQEHRAMSPEVGQGAGPAPVPLPGQATPQPLQPVYAGPNKPDLTTEQRAKLFNRHYFEKYPGSQVGWYWDFPHHHNTFRKVMERKPESVLELGAGRGYLLKRLEDAGIRCFGFDISNHAWLTRVSDRVGELDLLDPTWGTTEPVDLCLSVSFLEHVPEQHLPSLFARLTPMCKRGLHAITFQGEENAPDEMRCTLHPKQWWSDRLPVGHEVVSVREMEDGAIPEELVRGQGHLCVNAGCAQTMFLGWQNIDCLDFLQFALQHRYHFQQVDMTQGLPWGTGVVDCIACYHSLEHMDAKQGINFLKECRRVIRPDGAMRVSMPDAFTLTSCYADHSIGKFDEVNDNAANSPTRAGKLWALLNDGHRTAYDHETLFMALSEAGWTPYISVFRGAQTHPRLNQIRKETCEMSYGYSLFVDAVPTLG